MASGDRYDYDYRADELKEWVQKVRDLAGQARRTYLFFNNCHAGHAARSAKLMQELLRQQEAAGSSRQRLLHGTRTETATPANEEWPSSYGARSGATGRST